MTPTATRPVVLVIGYAGSIGSRICSDLADDADDYDVVGLDRRAPEQDDPAYGRDGLCDGVWLQCDLTDGASVEAALARVNVKGGARCGIAPVVHRAACLDVPAPPWDRNPSSWCQRVPIGIPATAVISLVLVSLSYDAVGSSLSGRDALAEGA